MTEKPKLLAHEEQKLRELLRRSDALGEAWEAIWETEDWGSDEHKAQTLWMLGEMSAEAEQRFRSYRDGLGIPDRPSRKKRLTEAVDPAGAFGPRPSSCPPPRRPQRAGPGSRRSRP